MRAVPVTPRQVMFTVCGQCPSLHAEGLIYHTYLSIYLSTYVSIYLSVCLSIYIGLMYINFNLQMVQMYSKRQVTAVS